MARGNDAIPSWSGFNYQGKVAILCALQQINQNANIEDYSIEHEKREDFTVLKVKKQLPFIKSRQCFRKKTQLLYTLHSAKRKRSSKATTA